MILQKVKQKLYYSLIAVKTETFKWGKSAILQCSLNTLKALWNKRVLSVILPWKQLPPLSSTASQFLDSIFSVLLYLHFLNKPYNYWFLNNNCLIINPWRVEAWFAIVSLYQTSSDDLSMSAIGVTNLSHLLSLTIYKIPPKFPLIGKSFP